MKSIAMNFCVLAIVVTIPGLAVAADSEKKTWTIDGTERVAWVRSPTNEDPAGAPLILVFHGWSPGNKTARNLSHDWRFDQYWPEAYVVYMQGLPFPKQDPNDKNTGFQGKPDIFGNRDLKFVDAVLADFKKDHHVDRKRIYAVGFSNGAGFTYVLWAARPGTFAAFAPCSHPPDPTVKLKVPKPVLVVAGQADTHVPIQAEEATIEQLRTLNGARGAGKPTEGGVVVYESTKGTPVATLIHSGGHELPEATFKPIVDFFRAQSLKH